jgi:glycosyltransferase involved in cell wall biosynthesis
VSGKGESLRVLHLTPHFPPVLSGIADYAGWLTAELAELGLDMRVLTSPRSAQCEIPGVGISATVESWDRRLWAAVAKEVGDFQPNVLHIHYQQLMYEGDRAIGLLPWALAMRRRRPAIVTTLHDMTPPARAPRIAGRLAFEALMYGSDRLLVSGEAEQRGVSKRPTLRARTTVLPIGSNIPVQPTTEPEMRRLRASVAADEKSFLLVYFGLIRPGKGVEVLLDSIAALRDRQPRIELLVIGDTGDADGDGRVAYRDRLLDQRRRLNLEDQVKFLGRLPEARVSELLQACDLAVLPFLHGASTSHTSVFAALSHGLPLVTTRGPSTPAVFTDGAMTLVPAPPDAAGLAEVIEELMKDPTKRRTLAAKGRELADRHSRPAIAAKVAAIYSAVTTTSRA